MKIAITGLMLLASMTAGAGWTSGGGQLIKDGHNPWFMTNTSEIKYCVMIDEQNFGQTTDQVVTAIETAFRFWKRQFQEAPETYSSVGSSAGSLVGPIVLAQQNIRRVPCSSPNSPDIKFQFGQLDGDQFKDFSDPKQFVAAAVRVEYDKVNLRAKGYLYFSPERGPLQLNLTGLIPNPWSSHEGTLLVPVMIHELGHVFGLQHSEGPSGVKIMSENFPEELLTLHKASYQAEVWKRLVKDGMIEKIHLFKYFDNESEGLANPMLCAEISPIENPQPIVEPTPTPGPKVSNKAAPGHYKKRGFFDSKFDQFMGIDPKAWHCRVFSINQKKFILQVANPKTQTELTLGTAVLRREDGYYDQIPVVRFWIPEEQKVYKFSEYSKTIDISYAQSLTKFKGTYSTTDGKISRKLTITVSPFGAIRFGGEMDGELYLDLYDGF